MACQQSSNSGGIFSQKLSTRAGFSPGAFANGGRYMTSSNFFVKAAFGLWFLAAPAYGAGQQPASVCGGQPLCYETSDFAATVTSFRLSTNNIYKQQIMDVTLRFQNKTDRLVVLGYVDHSGLATDDRGNRSIPWGPNAYRGIGLVTGNSFEPKLTVRPGGWNDAQFELVQQGTPQNTGSVFVLELTIAQILPAAAGSGYTLGGEFPLHFEGLVNGASALPGVATGLNPCGQPSRSAQDAVNKASAAASAISSIGSIFNKKKTAQTAGQVSSAAGGCDPRIAASTAATGAAAGAVVAGASARPQSTATTSDSQKLQSQPASPAAGINSPSAAELAENTQAAGQSKAAASPSKGDLRGAALADPGEPDANLGTAKAAATSGKYDVLGIKVGMPAKEALNILKAHGQFQVTPETIKYDFLPSPMTYGVMAANAVVVRNGGRILPDSEKIYLVVTMPPSQPVIAKISRYLAFSKDSAPTAQSLIADLTKKYGTPSYDSRVTDLYASPGYRELFWVDDAQGRRLLNQVNPGGGYSEQINNCRSVSTFSFPGANPADPSIQVDSVRIKQELEQGYTTQYPKMYDCANLTIIYAKIFYGYPVGISAHDVAGGLVVVLGSAPLDHTAADATREYLVQAAKNRDLAQKQKAQKNKPVL
jgi:hypothetical protein